MNRHPGKESIVGLKQELKNAQQTYLAHLPDIKESLKQLLTSSTAVNKSWSGSSWGYHSNLYFGDFDAPAGYQMFNTEWGLIHGIPDGWHPRTDEEVSAKLHENYTGRELAALESDVDLKVNVADQLREHLLAELSWLESDAGMEQEAKLLREVENSELRVQASRLAKILTVTPTMSRDSAALSQGSRVPYHVQFQAKVAALSASLDNVDKMLKKSERLIRQLEVKNSMAATSGDVDALAKLERLFRRFHAVARQLRSRHASRPTLEINDEYDVQDLLHALLRVEFDDIRAEEWTPSYAGGSSRMDFLLKPERAVIEVKKTRSGLTDKEVGEQLIIDIAKYQRSADCANLICFVYDPEGLIGNPNGLITDLNGLSNDGISVSVFIHPGT